MDKSEKVLGMGKLRKSPTKRKDKAIFKGYWNSRWCVFSEITYSSLSGKETKLVLNYFENEESYKKDVPPKGQLNISDCVEIKSHFKSQAGYHHIFTIQCLDGKFGKFSPSSCEEKLKWLTLLCKYKGKKPDNLSEYDSRISRSSSFADDFDTSEVRSETSSLASDSSDGLLVDNEGGGLFRGMGRCDSGTFSTSTISSSGSSIGTAPPLPPPRKRSSEFRPSQSDSEAEKLQYGVAGNRDSGIFQAPFEPNGCVQKNLRKLDEQEAYADEKKLGSSILCEYCLDLGKRTKKGLLRRRSSNKKPANADQMIEVERGDNEAYAREPSIPDAERSSHQSSEDSFSYENPPTIKYTEIDEEFLQQVDQFVKLQDEEEFGNKADYDDDDHGIYVPMNLFRRKEPEDDKEENQDEENLLVQGLRISEHAHSNEIPSDEKETTIDKEASIGPVPNSLVRTSLVPTSTVLSRPVPTDPVPTSLVPTSLVPTSLVPTSLVPTRLGDETLIENMDKPKEAVFFIMDL